jgi:mannose-1-phosphate guanylyltransferase/mannose-6-phosphate isomerase
VNQVTPVILSGGSGTRLWPLSREHYPKQLLALVGDKTLLQQTALRLDGLAAVAQPLVVCNEEHRFLVAEQLRQIDRPAHSILLEPAGRNTAPALTLAALSLMGSEPDGIMLVMPADHVVRDRATFQRAVTEGAHLARQDRLVTFGIVPTSPETGYGYIRKGEPIVTSAQDAKAYAVGAFVEKPELALARDYLADGGYLWNSGIFMMRASVWLAEIERHRPDIFRACREAARQSKTDVDFLRVDRLSFERCPSDSIDYAVMEKTERAVVVSLAAGWSDVGSWAGLWQVSDRDANGNVLRGDVLTADTRNSLLFAEHRLLAVVGLEDVVAVETADAILVAHRDRSQDVKDIVQRLGQDGRDERISHRRVYRPWGYYESIDRGERFQAKRITVKPGAALSLQMHKHRAEHWVVVKGTARVTRGDEVFELSENQSTYIPIGTKHRLENPGKEPLEMIEVQSGSYLGEDDILRFEDLYNREQPDV